jgi:hypothetical protein
MMDKNTEEYRESLEYAHVCGIGLYFALLREGRGKDEANRIALADATLFLRQMTGTQDTIEVLGQY